MTVATLGKEKEKLGSAGKHTSTYFPVATENGTFFRRHYYQIVTSLEILVDYLTIFISFLLAKGLHFSIGLSRFETFQMVPLTLMGILHVAAICGLMILVFAGMGLYRKNLSLLNIDEMRRLFRAVIFIAVIVFTVSFYLRIPFSRLLITMWLSLILFFMIMVKMVFFKIHQALHRKGLNIKRVLIYGAGEIGRKLYKNILTFPKLGYRAIGFVDDDMDFLSQELSREDVEGKAIHKLLGASQDLDRVIRDYKIDELIIARKGMSSGDILEITTKCKKLNIQFKIRKRCFCFFDIIYK